MCQEKYIPNGIPRMYITLLSIKTKKLYKYFHNTRGKQPKSNMLIDKGLLLYNTIKQTIFYAKAFDCVDHNKLENSGRDGNTRPPDLLLEKPVCRSGGNS